MEIVEKFGFRKSLNLENYIFKRNINWLLNIYYNSEKLANFKAKQIQDKILRINDTLLSTSALVEEKQKSFEDFVYYKFHFNFLTLHALFISSYSIFENHLFKIAKQLETYSLSKIKITDMDRVRET